MMDRGLRLMVREGGRIQNESVLERRMGVLFVPLLVWEETEGIL